tara:strand:- start:542 stop:1465 length:924 start_codon:yes stop_codon:yes gene_type:complete
MKPIKIIEKIKISFNGNFLVFFLSLVFIANAISQNISSLSLISLNIYSYLFLLLSVFVTSIGLIVNALAWKKLLYWLGYRSKNIDLVKVFLGTNILKYIPGGIWHLVQRFRILNKFLGHGSSIAAVLLEPLLMAVAALILVTPGDWNNGIGIVYLLPSLIFFKYFREPILITLEKIKIKKIKELFISSSSFSSLDKFGTTSLSYPLGPLLTEIIFVFLRFIGYWLCLCAFSIQNSSSFLSWLSIFSFAWTIGLIVPGAPGGLGVFEAAILLKIGPSFPEAGILASLISYRLVTSLSDVIGSVFAKLK